MNFSPPKRHRGIALIMVMVVIFVLAGLAMIFSANMRVEVTLARNATHDTDLFWLGWSGAELARYVLAQEMTNPNEPYDSLNQKWAGGPGGTNDGLADITLDNVQIGKGTISIKITDMERKFNINSANEEILRQAMIAMGAEATDSSTAVDSILDWIDNDGDLSRVSGWESKDYEMLPQPYFAKNGPIDDMTELLLIHGITPEMYWGSAITRHAFSTPAQRISDRLNQMDEPLYPFGLVDLFNPLGRQLNVNTASAEALQVIPGIDANIAAGIVQQRAGLDGVDGTEDDLPFQNPGEIVNVPGMSQGSAGQMIRYLTVRSSHFKVEVDARIDQARRHFVAMISRSSATDIQVLYMNWE